MNFRDRIKHICKSKGITQKNLAEKLGITNISLNQTLRGEYPQLQTLEKIANVLDVPLSELFEKPSEHSFTCPNCGTHLKISKDE